MKRIILALLIGLTLSSCFHDNVSKCGPCPAIAIASYINVRIVDENTGADLFLSPGAPYKPSDLKITTSVDGSPVPFLIDSLSKAERYIKIPAYQTQTFTLMLASLPSDQISMAVKIDSPVCCPQMKITQISLNKVPVCRPCSFNEFITIQK